MYVLFVFYGHVLFEVLPGRPQARQAPAQCLQSPQQEDLPFFLSFMIFATIAAMIPARTIQIIMVPQFIEKNVSMFRSSFPVNTDLPYFRMTARITVSVITPAITRARTRTIIPLFPFFLSAILKCSFSQ